MMARKIWLPHGLRDVAAALPMLLMLGVGAVKAAPPSVRSQLAFEYHRGPEAVVVRYVQVLTEVRAAEPGPSLTVYGDRRVVVHYPDYMVRAGSYAAVLSEGEMNDLLSSLVSAGVPGFDAAAVEQQKRQARLERFERTGRISTVAGAEVTRIELHLESYRPAEPGAEMQRNVQATARWEGLQWDAERYPEIDALARLAAAERELRALMERDDLERIQ